MPSAVLTPRTSDEQQEESRAPRKKEAAGSSRRDDLGGAVSAPNKPWKQQDQIERKTFLELCKEQGPRVELFENPFGRKSVGTIVEVGSNRNGVTIRFQPETGRTRTTHRKTLGDSGYSQERSEGIPLHHLLSREINPSSPTEVRLEVRS
jgi:hypothetical protein